MLEANNFTTLVQEVFAYILKGEDTVENKIEIIDRWIKYFPADPDIKFFRAIKDFMKAQGSPPSYDHLIKNYGFTYLPTVVRYKLEDIFDLIGKEYDKRRKEEISNQMSRLSQSLAALPIDAAMIEMDKLREGLRGQEEKYRPDVSIMKMYEERKGKPVGLLTFMKQLDAEIGGVEDGTIFTIAGFTGAFKTMTAVNFMYNNVVEMGYNVVYITLEVVKEMLLYMLLSRHSWNPKFAGKGRPISAIDIRKGVLTPEQESFLRDVVEPDLMASKGKFVIWDDGDIPVLNAPGIEKVLSTLPFSVDAIFVDYVQQIQYDQANMVRGISIIDYIVQQFRRLAIKCNGKPTRIFLLSQVNRDGWRRARKNKGRYELTALSEAHEIERSSFYVMFLYTDDVLKQSGEVKVTFAKHRGGNTIPDVIVAFTDPRFCVVGDDVQGFVGGDINYQNFMDVLGDGFDF